MNERLGVRFARIPTCAVAHAVGLLLVSAAVPAFGQPMMFLIPVEVTINAGDSITIQVFLENVAPTLLRAYQVEFPQFAGGGVAGTVTHDPQGTSACGVYQPFVPGNPDECVDGFCVDGGNACVIDPQCPGIPDIPEFHPSPCIDLSNPDYVLAGVVALPAVSAGPPPRLGSAALAAGDSVLVTDPKYLGEFVYTASEDGGGVFTIEPQNIPGGSFLRDGGSPPGDIPFTALGSIITVIQCVVDGDCDDGNACTANTCESGICVSTPLYDAETECCNPANGNTTLIDDENDCTDDICDAKKGVVTHPPFAVDTPCGDPNSSECDDADTCDGAGGCQPNFVPEGSACGGPADTQCTDPDTCDGAGACQANDAADGSDCDDGAFCNTGEACAGGVCTGGAPLDCGDGIPCTQDACDEKTDACENV
ncbi:MAG: hypothetical protein IID36_08695, partial [Planctomycetes bacterium]|nr:hypothetical protein [Planctomycetota bacterium]